MSTKKSPEHYVREFSRRASSYRNSNLIQKSVAKKLVANIEETNIDILDLGCGQGEVYELLKDRIKSFVGVDLAENMCSFHPKSDKIKIYNENFDLPEFYEKFRNISFDYIVSSSALQWSKNRVGLYKNIKPLSNKFLFAVFTDKTFSHLHKFCSLGAILPSLEELKKELTEVFGGSFKIDSHDYKLSFEDKRKMFHYIKQSGVSGGVKRLSYLEAKNLYQKYDRDFLEYEVAFIEVFLEE